MTEHFFDHDRLDVYFHGTFIWYTDLLVKVSRTKYRGLAPHKITPMLGVLHRSIRSGVLNLETSLADVR